MKKVLQVVLMSAALVAGPAVASAAQVNDAWITMKTKIALLTADDVRSIGLNVDTAEGVVTLHGKVSTEAEKARAATVAKGIEGVKEVKNLLQVVPEKAETVVEANDDAIKDNLDRQFKADAMLKDSNIKVASVNKGVVLLQGDTTQVAAELKAVETAHAVAGVRRVVNEIKVTGKTR